MNAYQVYDMADNKKLHDVIATNEVVALDIVSHYAPAAVEDLVVCNAHGVPIADAHTWYEEVMNG